MFDLSRFKHVGICDIRDFSLCKIYKKHGLINYLNTDKDNTQ
jgi:hypothetical protein